MTIATLPVTSALSDAQTGATDAIFEATQALCRAEDRLPVNVMAAVDEALTRAELALDLTGGFVQPGTPGRVDELLERFRARCRT
ncbi:MAG: hypothetical protein WBE92_15995 [Steroidobacteraceae bacterium]